MKVVKPSKELICYLNESSRLDKLMPYILTGFIIIIIILTVVK